MFVTFSSWGSATPGAPTIITASRTIFFMTPTPPTDFRDRDVATRKILSRLSDACRAAVPAAARALWRLALPLNDGVERPQQRFTRRVRSRLVHAGADA